MSRTHHPRGPGKADRKVEREATADKAKKRSRLGPSIAESMAPMVAVQVMALVGDAVGRWITVQERNATSLESLAKTVATAQKRGEL